MGYKKEPVGHMKASTGNKAVGYMAEGSTAYMSALNQNGVVVTGDASEVGGQTTMTELEKKKAAAKRKIEAKKIEIANQKMQKELERETRRAEVGARIEKRRQELREKEGKDYIDPKSGNVVRRARNLPLEMKGSVAHQVDPKDGGTKKMKDLPLNTRARYEEYRDRNWKQDETSLGKVGGDNITDLTKWQKTGKSKDIQRRMPRK